MFVTCLAPSSAVSAPLSPCYAAFGNDRPSTPVPNERFEPRQFTIKGVSFTTKPLACVASDKFVRRLRIENPFFGTTVFDPRWPAEGSTPNPDGWYVSPDQKWQNTVGAQIQRRALALRDPENALEHLLTREFIEEHDVDQKVVLAQILEPMIEDGLFGLRAYYRGSTLLKKTGSIRYRQAEGDTRQIYISCVTEAWRGPHPSCRAYFYWPGDGLGIQIDFLKAGLAEWEIMAERAREQIIQWRD